MDLKTRTIKEKVKGKTETKKEIDWKFYKRKIDGLNKIYWQLILEGGMAKTDVDSMTIDKMLEAFAALSVLSKQKRGE